MKPDSKTSNPFNFMKFMVKYCCVLVVTLYCGIIGLVGGVAACSFMVEKLSSAASVAPSSTLFDAMKWIGGAFLGGLPIAYIAANWIGARFGWATKTADMQRSH